VKPALDVEPAAPLLRAAGIAKRYGAAPEVLCGVSLAISPGERVALIGPNGSGKSTLLRCLVGLSPLSAGRVEALGESLDRAPSPSQRSRLRSQLGFVFQFHGLVRRRTALSNVIHGLIHEPGGWRAFTHTLAPTAFRERALRALADVGLGEKALARADALSGGQQQRVAIARALVRRPRLLIADEPAASLDPAAGRDVMALFASLAGAYGATLLYTSHDMEHARAYSDRVIALRRGGVLFDAPSAAVTDAMLREVFDG
jgi:phosphonate transport system ATP-binding protein